MAIRIDGLYSGLDTTAMVKELTSAYSTKKENIEKQQTSLKWKQEQWEELNKEIYSFYTNSLSYNRYANNSYKATYGNDKVITVNNPNKNNIGTHTIEVEELAKTGYLTGKELDKSTTEKTKIKDLFKHPHVGGRISVNGYVIEVTDKMTIGELAEQIAQASNIHANYDSLNHRIYISALKPGKENDFNIQTEDDGGKEILEILGIAGDGASRVQGSDATIKFNGVTYTSTSNNFNINGLNIEAKSVSGPTQVTIDSSSDLISETVNNFVNSYNNLLEKMQNLYNKKSAKEYAPLSEKEKDVMSDKEIEKWEARGKENILSRDNSLRTIINLFKDSTLKMYNINGEKTSLASIGITTKNYFSTSTDKRGILEIDKDKLEKAIAENPDKVVQLIKSLSSDLYDKLDQNSKSSTVKSAYKFYNDKELSNKIKDYDKKIEDWENKVIKMEEKYYKQFTAMEKALAQMQNQSSIFSTWFN